MSKRTLPVLWALLVSLAGGCGTDSDDVLTPAASGPAESPEQKESGSPPPAVELAVASWDEVQAMIAEHKGKVVVVDLWSTSCIPCLRELPNLADLQQRYPHKIVCMSVNIDYTGASGESPEALHDKVLAMLTRRGVLNCRNVICSTPDGDLYDRIDLGSIPAVYLYDQRGSLAKRFDNDYEEYGDEGFTYRNDIIPLVERTLGSG